MNRRLALDDNEWDYVGSILALNLTSALNRSKLTQDRELKAVLELEAGICSDILEGMRDA